MDYLKFLEQKEIMDRPSGFDVKPEDLNSVLFDWQALLVSWALKRGRAALFEDCGLGKTIQQLVWGEQVSRHINGPVLILAPLAVAEQTVEEGRRFGIKVNLCRNKDDVKNGINITNYEKLHKFDTSIFPGVVLDESGILKNFAGATRNALIDAFKNTPYRLACTATPAPNDWIELGNHAEFLGVMTRSEMLATFFINDSGDTGKWRLKGHIKDNYFWKWMSSWSVMMSKPSDLGFDDDGFILPEITYHEHFVDSDFSLNGKGRQGFFPQYVKMDLQGRRRIRRGTLDDRVQITADFINETDDRWVIWCGLNDEGTSLTKLIDGAVEVAGRHDNDEKAKKMMDFARGDIQRIVTKPDIAGHGMNWQVCHRIAFVGLSDSWEDFYQATRRVWRFGQTKSVDVHIFLAKQEGKVLKNVMRKDDQAQKMIQAMVNYTKELTKHEIMQSSRVFVEYDPQTEMEVPNWLIN